MKKLSIIIAVYNIEDYIGRCLDSVIKQKGDDIEILIVNDGSTDNSLNICQEYEKKDNRIRIISGKNKGLNAVRNAGYKNSTGEYIWHIDGDDYIEDNSVEILRKYIDKYDIIYFNYKKIENNKIIKVKYNKNYDNLCDKYILGYNVVWNKIIKRNIFDKDRFPEKCVYDDIYIIPTLVCKTNNILFIDDFLYYYVYRITSLSNTVPFNLKDILYCLDNVYSKTYNEYPIAAVCFYINQLLVYNYAKEILNGYKYDYKKLNQILKEKFPKYYKNKYYNDSIYKKIYIRLVYFDCIFLVKLCTYFKLKLYNKYIKKWN